MHCLLAPLVPRCPPGAQARGSHLVQTRGRGRYPILSEKCLWGSASLWLLGGRCGIGPRSLWSRACSPPLLLYDGFLDRRDGVRGPSQRTRHPGALSATGGGLGGQPIPRISCEPQALPGRQGPRVATLPPSGHLVPSRTEPYVAGRCGAQHRGAGARAVGSTGRLLLCLCGRFIQVLTGRPWG